MKAPPPFRANKQIVANIWDTGFGIEFHGCNLYGDETEKLIDWLKTAVKYVEWKTAQAESVRIEANAREAASRDKS